jgi:hypothetical protein
MTLPVVTQPTYTTMMEWIFALIREHVSGEYEFFYHAWSKHVRVLATHRPACIRHSWRMALINEVQLTLPPGTFMDFEIVKPSGLLCLKQALECSEMLNGIAASMPPKPKARGRGTHKIIFGPPPPELPDTDPVERRAVKAAKKRMLPRLVVAPEVPLPPSPVLPKTALGRVAKREGIQPELGDYLVLPEHHLFGVLPSWAVVRPEVDVMHAHQPRLHKEWIVQP